MSLSASRRTSNSDTDSRSTERSATQIALDQVRAEIHDPGFTDEPRHGRLRTALLNALAAGHWSPGDKLPSETELARAVGLSVGTVQKTLARLATEQVLVRRHGHGTYVSGVEAQSDQLLHFRFLGDDDAAIVPVYAEALDRTVIRSPGPWAHFLQGASEFIRIRRKINVSDEFNCLSEFYIDKARFGAILTLPFSELHRVIIRDVLAKSFNAPTFTISQRVYVAAFPPRVSGLLNHRPKGAFGLILEVSSYTHHRSPLSFQRIYVPAGVRPLEIPGPRMLR